MRIKKIIRGLRILTIVILNSSCDQIAKALVRSKIGRAEYINFVENHFILTHVDNTAAMPGLGHQLSPGLKSFVLQLLPLLVLLALLFRLLHKTGIFNLTDGSITCGILFILFLLVRQRKIAL